MNTESSDDQALEAELDRLRKDTRELRELVQYLKNGQANLEGRLQRVENSVVFRFLRWLGRRLESIGVPIDRGIPTLTRIHGTGPAVDQRYLEWVKETSLLQSLRSARAGESPPLSDPPNISILLQCHQPERARLARTLASLDSQQYSNWDLLVCAGAEPPAWLDACVSPRPGGHSVEIVRGSNPRGSFEAALGKCRGEFVAILNADTILEPDALASWLPHARPGTTAVYSDWDHIDAQDQRHTPRFTPEFSERLLTDTLYWGRCFFARTTKLPKTNWRAGAPVLPLEHDLALQLAQQAGSIVRVPRMLWHMQAEAAQQHTDSDSARVAAKSANGPQPEPGSAGVNARASIVICSRNPDNLRKCLKSLLPTLGGRHEVIIVAHRSGDEKDLEEVCASYGVRMVPYEGAFHFGVMNGLGVTVSTGQALCFLNDDVFPITSDWLDSMLAQAVQPDVGAAGALLLYPNGTIQHAGVVVGGSYFPSHVGRLQVESLYWPWLRMTREVTAVTAACMALRRTVWDELGGFDPRFPVNYNDTDFCLRAGQRGYRILMEARAVLTHEESKTRIPSVLPEEHELFHQRWGSVMSAPDRFFNPQLALDPIQLPPPGSLAG